MRLHRPFEVELMEALPILRGYCVKLTRSVDRGEDLVQDTIVKALSYEQNYVLGTKMGAWLCFIARNQFLSIVRRAWRSVPMEDGQVDRIAVDAHPVHQLELKETLKAMTFLPPEQAEALMLISDGMSYEDVALLHSTETGTIKSRVSRARAALGAYFGGR